MSLIKKLLELLLTHEKKYENSFSMVSSENLISPLAKRVFHSDAYSRYYFDNINQWGTWAFPGGNIIGKIENDILIPLLQEMTTGKYINVKPVSGLNCMLITILSYCKTNDCICLMPFELGGHPSAAEIAKDTGLKIIYAPSNKYDIDWDKFLLLLKKHKPKLIYIDQAHVLFPVSVRKIKQILNSISLDSKIHVDSSHLNGLIFGNVSPNPLIEGADSFGGSTHKTLSGPHKAFLATNNKDIADKFSLKSSYLTSHHHMADVIALAIVLLEYKEKKGSEYAEQIIKNAKAFGEALHNYNLNVQAKDLGYTNCHQIWLDPSTHMNAIDASKNLLDAGIIVNTFQKLPFIGNPAFRIGLNEITNYGLKEAEMSIVASFFNEIIVKKNRGIDLNKKVKDLRRKFNTAKYCFTKQEAINLLPFN